MNSGFARITHGPKCSICILNTKLPSNLRPTTRECVYLVTRGHFRSREKDGGYSIRSAIAKTLCYQQTWRLYVIVL